MFVKVQDSMFASAININNFDVITVRRHGSEFKISAYKDPFESEHSYNDIASFASSQQAIQALVRLMEAVARKEPYWSLD